MAAEHNYLELLNSQNKEAFVANWRLKGSNNSVRRVPDKELGVTVCILDGSSSQTSIRLPKDPKTVLKRAERYLVLQLFIPDEADFSVLLTVTANSSSRRILFSTAVRDTDLSQTHLAKIPFGSSLQRDRWTNLCLDQSAFVSELWSGQHFDTLDTLVVTATCRLRRVFLLQNLDSGEAESSEWCSQQYVPRALRISNGSFQLLTPDRIRGSSGTAQKAVRVKTTDFERHAESSASHVVSVSPHPPDNAPQRPAARRPRPAQQAVSPQQAASRTSGNARGDDAGPGPGHRHRRPVPPSTSPDEPDDQLERRRTRTTGSTGKNKLRESTSADSLIGVVAESRSHRQTPKRTSEARSLRNRSESLENARDAQLPVPAAQAQRAERPAPRTGGGLLFTFANPPKVALPPTSDKESRDGSAEKARLVGVVAPQKVENLHFSTDFSLPRTRQRPEGVGVEPPMPIGSRGTPRRAGAPPQTRRISRDRLRELSKQDVIQKASPRSMTLESVHEDTRDAEQPTRTVAPAPPKQVGIYQVADLSDSCEARMLESLRREQEDELQSDSSSVSRSSSAEHAPAPASPSLVRLGLDRDLLHYETNASVDEQQFSSSRDDERCNRDASLLENGMLYADEMRLLLLGNRWNPNLDVSNPRVASPLPQRASNRREDVSHGNESETSRLLMIANSNVNTSGLRTSSEELDLVFDPTLNCYYDPQNGRYYELS